MHLHDHALDVSSYIYFGKEHKQNEKNSQIDLDTDQILSRFNYKLLDVIGREVLKEKTPTLHDLEYTLKQHCHKVQSLITRRKRQNNLMLIYVQIILRLACTCP